MKNNKKRLELAILILKVLEIVLSITKLIISFFN